MKPAKLATLCASLLVIVGSLDPFFCAQSTPKAIVVRPSPTSSGSGQQELELKGVKTSSDVAGVRVFLDPGPDSKLDVNSKSYLGSVYFSHQDEANSKSKEGNFVLPIRSNRKVTGPIRVVIYPISGKGSPVSADVQVREASIKPVDNSAFQ